MYCVYIYIGIDTTPELFATARHGQSRVTNILPKPTPEERHDRHNSPINLGYNVSRTV